MASVLDYADVLVDIRGQGQEAANGQLAFDCVVQVQGSGERRGTIELDENLLDIAKPDEYGATLGEALSTPAFSAAVAEARAIARSGVRLRLQIDERADRLQSLRWELARLEDRPGAASLVDTATSSATPFSRYVPLAEQD